MNSKQKQELKRKIIDTLRIAGTSHINCFRTNIASTLKHENKKYEIYQELVRNGNEVITEAIFKNGGRADILNLSTGDIIEITYSETEKKVKEKIKKYPEFLNVIIIKAK